MPGMMDTILNLGLNDKSVEGISNKSGNARFAWDSYRRLIQMFGDVVMEVEHAEFEHILENVKDTKGAKYDTDLTTEDLKEIVTKYKDKIKEIKGVEFPQDPIEQLFLSINAVFSSWNKWNKGINRNSSKYSINGIWKFGRRFRNRSMFYKKPFYWRSKILR
jgi:pyruvate,orthophosphate dikinase